MTPLAVCELDEIVAEIKPEIVEYPEAQERSFTSFKELKEYFENEARFWQQTS